MREMLHNTHAAMSVSALAPRYTPTSPLLIECAYSARGAASTYLQGSGDRKLPTDNLLDMESFHIGSTARLAQSAERKAFNLVVVGASPTVGEI